MKKQVKKEHYNFEKYVNKERFMSYYYQLKIIYDIDPKNILEIGVGNNFLKKVLSDKYLYKTLDFDKSLKPDIYGSVTNIPIKDNSFDLVACFQVLEHLPFDQFEKSLKELSRVSRKHVILSLPYANFSFIFLTRIVSLGKLYFNLSIPKFYRTHKFDGQHYWEIGSKGYPISKIRKILEKYFTIHDVIHPIENKYHIFFVLKKK